MNLCKNSIRNVFGRSGNGETIDLADKIDGNAVESSMIKAWFVGCTVEFEGWPGKDAVYHGCPETGRLGMTLEGVMDGEDVAKLDGWAFENVFQPSFERSVNSNV